MKLALFVYLANLSDKLSITLAFAASCLLLAVIIFTLIFPILFDDFFKLREPSRYYSDTETGNYNENIMKNRKIAKKCTIISIALCLVFSTISILIPSERTLYIMAGAYAAEQIAKSDKAQKISDDVLDVIERKLEKMKND